MKIATTIAAAATSLMIGAAAYADSLPSDDTIPTDNGAIALHAIHHAALTLTWNNIVIMADPAPPQGKPPADPTAEYKALPAPNLILITHDHGDHFNVPILEAIAGNATILAPKEVADKMPADLKAKTKVMANGDTTTFEGIQVAAFPMYNTTPSRAQFHPKGGGNGYILTISGRKIYIAGDTEETPDMKALTGVDAAFLPMNLPYTMDINAAAQAIRDFKPKVAYPYHYSDTDVTKLQGLVGDAAQVKLLNWYPQG